MLKEFKEFIARGNIVDLAVAVVIGTAFTTLIKSFVDNVLMPLVAAILGGNKPDFTAYFFTIGESKIRYGTFLTALVSFVILAFAVFLVVKAINKFYKKEEADAGPSEIDLLTDIREILSRK
ncbi:MAG: large conductance mechanosensitive channel protein MscL [Acidimicrobiia bacterium]|jgi:large conductance mechanosensitive channel|nr:large conductance mechanosensitive channel protein MscL [Acidimicrobiia bacterium]MBP8179432.1 large conductance mechanosensitive channel protein MscL [Acidimicrobiia bacterium]